MTRTAILRLLGMGVLLAALSGCAAISTVTAAGERLENYELRALPAAGRAITGRRHLQIEPPAASGAIATDRILIKPTPLQAEYLPGSRWVDEAPEHVQRLVARSLTETGRFALVSTGGVQPDPDYLLLIDLQAFQAEMDRAQDTTRVVVRLKVTIVDDEEREIIASRAFERTVPAGEPTVEEIVPAFDRAMLGVLAEVATWTVRMVG